MRTVTGLSLDGHFHNQPKDWLRLDLWRELEPVVRSWSNVSLEVYFCLIFYLFSLVLFAILNCLAVLITI